MNHSMKISIVGSRGVGKTSFIKRHSTGDFKDYNPPQFIHIEQLSFRTTIGNVNINVWDYPGTNEIVPSLVTTSDAVFIMFDTTNRESYEHALKWLTILRQTYNGFIVVCGNKIDSVKRIVKPSEIHIKNKKTVEQYKMIDNTVYYDISSKSNYNVEKPFLASIRNTFRDYTSASTEPINFW